MAKKRRRSRYKLNAGVIRSIAAYIRAGGYPHVAAEAAGIPRDVYTDWLTQGEPGKKARGSALAKSLWTEVLKATAQARLAAEIKAFTEEPLAWLKSGPGKERAKNPGWSATVKPVHNENNTQVNLLLAPEMQSVFAAILQILGPWPDARIALASALGAPSALPPILIETHHAAEPDIVGTGEAQPRRGERG